MKIKETFKNGELKATMVMGYAEYLTLSNIIHQYEVLEQEFLTTSEKELIESFKKEFLKRK